MNRSGTKKFYILMLLMICVTFSLSAYQYEGIVSFNADESDTEPSGTYTIDTTKVLDLSLTLERELYGDKQNEKPKDSEYSKVTFSTGSSLDVNNRILTHTNGTDTLSYNLYKDESKAQLLKSVDYYTSLDDVLFYEFPPESVPFKEILTQSFTHDYVAIIDADQFVPAGIYTDQIDMNLYLTWSKDAPETEPQPPADGYLSLSMAIEVQPYLGLSLTTGTTYVQQADSHSMGFGNLENYESRSVNVIAKSNVPYRITASSQHDGRIKHQQIQEYIPYTMSFNGTQIDLNGSSGNPVDLLTNSEMTPSTGIAYPMIISIGSVEGFEAGNYEDNISFEIIVN
jgi:hypothetical protein